MSYLTLLFSSQTLEMVNGSEAEHEIVAGLDSCEKAWTAAGNVPDDYLLPSGIVSMEHWLDLNA